MVRLLCCTRCFFSFKSHVDKILKCGHSNESYWAVLFCGAVYYAVQGGSNFWYSVHVTIHIKVLTLSSLFFSWSWPGACLISWPPVMKSNLIYNPVSPAVYHQSNYCFCFAHKNLFLQFSCVICGIRWCNMEIKNARFCYFGGTVLNSTHVQLTGLFLFPFFLMSGWRTCVQVGTLEISCHWWRPIEWWNKDIFRSFLQFWISFTEQGTWYSRQ